MQVDFYQLAGTPIEKTVPLLAAKTLENNEKMLIVADEDMLISKLNEALWAYDSTAFLPHGKASDPGSEGQPVLLSNTPSAANGAKFALIADGKWRDETLSFERVFYLFDDDQIDEARQAWKVLSQQDDVEPRYWKQEGGRWRQGP
ncbi:DNA polymerase III subunit chi [Parasphingopyxis sp. CP4]|uniref:DNA polymerase III subunit chi n=1 Tax=Parasphingopyxis sp. CP4 TaxID=2724527 RepID=UPI00159FCB5D|nr:DNA polymerase III subunit chi [Parasphingopyxis sp. CP4]QLC21446.1 DNA polymerase III subunit chi [Parasphingopyxis sp. CP4]